MRRDPTSGLVPPILTAVGSLVIPVALVVLATELPFLQRGLLTQPLTGRSGWPASAWPRCSRRGRGRQVDPPTPAPAACRVRAGGRGQPGTCRLHGTMTQPATRYVRNAQASSSAGASVSCFSGGMVGTLKPMKPKSTSSSGLRKLKEAER